MVEGTRRGVGERLRRELCCGRPSALSTDEEPATPSTTASEGEPAAEVWDAHLAHELRRGGYLLRQISSLIAGVRHAGGVGPLEATIERWRARLTTRGLSMLDAAAELSAYVEDRGHPPPSSPST